MNTIPTSTPMRSIPGGTVRSQQLLQILFASQHHHEAVWPFGSKPAERHEEGSDLDLFLDVEKFIKQDLLRLMAAINELLLPCQLDVAMSQERQAVLEDHLKRVDSGIWG